METNTNLKKKGFIRAKMNTLYGSDVNLYGSGVTLW